MAKDKPEVPELQLPPDVLAFFEKLGDGDILSLLEKLSDGKVPTMAMDPVTATFNFGTMALYIVGKIIDTVPKEQHAENWERLDGWIEKLTPR